MNLLERLNKSFLYLITPASPRAGSLEEFLPRVLEAGVDMVQLREKEMEARELIRHAEVVRRRTEQFGAIFIINDRADIAVVAGADGLHLGQDDLSVADARRVIGGEKVVGLSTHSRKQIKESSKPGGADYIGVGPIYATPTKEGRPPVGRELIEYASGHATVPVYAIGGVDLQTLPQLLEAGARRVSVVRAITEADDPSAVAKRMKQALLKANS